MNERWQARGRVFRGAAALLGALLLAAAPAAAQEAVGCSPEIVRWAAACQSSAATAVVPEVCVQGRVVVRASIAGGAPLRVEIGPSSGSGFVREGAFALSPIGDFADWSQVPPGLRAALDGLRACVRSERGLDAGARAGLTALRDRTDAPTRPVWPWRALMGAAILLASMVRAARASPARAAREGALAAVAGVGSLVLHRALAPAAFFHQNGQGALWMRYALGEPSPYGRGYFELYSRVVSGASGSPEAALFAAQSVAVALGVAAFALALRSLGLRPVLAFAGAAVVAAEPALARMARSESYAGASFALVALAFAAAASAAREGRVRSTTFAALTIAAGLLASQAARVHPVGWMPAALLPLGVYAGVGSRPRRLRLALASGAVVGLTVALTSGAAMLDVVAGSLGRQWLPMLVELQGGRARVVLALGLAGVAAVAVGRGRWATLGRVGCGLIIAAVATSTTVEGPAPVWVYHSVALLFAPVFVAAASTALREIAPTRAKAVGLALALMVTALGVAARQRGAWARVPTDALEADRVRAWRDTLRAPASVTYLERAGHEVFVLPLYVRRGGVRVRAWVPSTAAPGAPALRPGDYYYRSSVCSTPTGRPWCEAIEGGLALVPVSVASLPAIPSVRDVRYEASRVRVGLYRVGR